MSNTYEGFYDDDSNEDFVPKFLEEFWEFHKDLNEILLSNNIKATQH